MDTFESILEKHPLDPYALHMAYFLALTTGHTSRMRDTPKSVLSHYKPSTPFFGNVHGKLSFGQSEMGEFQVLFLLLPITLSQVLFLQFLPNNVSRLKGWRAEWAPRSRPLPPGQLVPPRTRPQLRGVQSTSAGQSLPGKHRG